MGTVYTFPMNRACIAATLLVAALVTAPVAAQQRPEADICAVPPGAQPMLPAKLLPGMGDTNMPVTTKSEEARKFFNQGVSQIHSFWVIEAERSFLQAATLDPDMAMAYWGICGQRRAATTGRRFSCCAIRTTAAAAAAPCSGGAGRR